MAVRLSRPGRHVHPRRGAADRRRRRGRHARPRGPVRRARRPTRSSQNQIQTSSQAGLPQSITATDAAQFGPRIGFAWQPFGEQDGHPRRLRPVLRAGELGRSRQQQHGAVPARSDGVQRPDAADADDGRLLPRHAAGQLGGADHRRGGARAEDGPRPSLQPRHAAADRAVHRARGELRRQHRPLPERHAQHQHPGAGDRRHPGAAAVPDLRQHQLLRRLARDHLSLAAGLARAAHPRAACSTWRPTPGRRASAPRT